MFRKWFQKKTTQRCRPILPRPRPRLAVEQLEDRQLLSTGFVIPQSMTDLANMFPTHSGPTILYLNFDGGTVDGQTVSAFQAQSNQTKDQAIQDILYRVSEIYAPFNVQVLNGKVYVTYAKQNDAKHDDVAGPGHGFVDVYNLDGSPGLASGNGFTIGPVPASR